MIAIEGGLPTRSKVLSYGRQMIEEDDVAAVVSCLQSDYLTTGPYVESFEEAITMYTGAKYAVAFCNGTAALHGACHAAGISAGDEVITTPITFAASANCVLYCGGTPVFADIKLSDWLIDPDRIEERITGRTKAIIPVDFMGEMPDMDHIMSIARNHGLVVIEDGAHSIGSSYKGRRAGSIADMTMFSFHPVKTITTGEGGVITTNSEEHYRKLVSFRSHSITRNPEHLLERHHASWYYEQQDLGYNFRMTDIQAALGCSQIKKMERFKLRRTEMVVAYNSAFKNLRGIILPEPRMSSEACRHLYVIRVDTDQLTVDRDAVFRALQAENIGVNLHYVPVYKHPYYQRNGYADTICPNAEAYYSSAITLPLHVGMSSTDLGDVITAVKKVISYYWK